MSASRCPACGAALRPDAPWCLLCHRDLRPAPEPAPEPASVLELDPEPEPEPLPEPAAEPGPPGWPCMVCGIDNAMHATACAACGAEFLAGLREETDRPLRLPLIGDISRLGRSARLGLAVCVGLLIALLLSGLLALAGKVF
jgi:hypothetical protein